MKLKSKRMKVALVVLGLFLIGGLGGLLGAYLSGDSSQVAEGAHTLSLATPAFAQGGVASTTFLDEEAGISIYTDLAQSLDLATAKTVYKTIEKETSDYIVGSVSLPNLTESDDVHIFVHKDGWIVVYYLKAEPVSKIIDWNYYAGGQLTSNKLKAGLSKMCSALGVTATTTKYYHFQYPYAIKFMIVIESEYGWNETDTCRLTIPSAFTVYERSWSFYTYDTYSSSYFRIDGTTIYTGDGGQDSSITAYGQLTASQLSPDVSHTVTVFNKTYASYDYEGYTCVGIVLVYLEP